MKTKEMKFPLFDTMTLVLLRDSYEALLAAHIALAHLTQTHGLNKKGEKVMGLIEYVFEKARHQNAKRIEISMAHTIRGFEEILAKKHHLFGGK